MEKCFTDEEYKILLVTLQMVNEDPNKVDSIKKKLELIQADKKEDDVILKTEYSKAFDTKRKGLVLQSYFKYGKARSNFSTGRVDAISPLEKYLRRLVALEKILKENEEAKINEQIQFRDSMLTKYCENGDYHFANKMSESERETYDCLISEVNEARDLYKAFSEHNWQ